MIKKRKKTEFVRFKEVICPVLNVRANPSTNARALNTLIKSEIVECDPNFKDAEWDHIIARMDVDGYCMKKFLSPLSPDNTAALDMAASRVIHIGTPKCDSVIEEEAKDGDKEN